MTRAQDDAGIVAALADYYETAPRASLDYEDGEVPDTGATERAALFAAIDAWADERLRAQFVEMTSPKVREMPWLVGAFDSDDYPDEDPNP